MPGNGFPFSIRVGRQDDFIAFIHCILYFGVFPLVVATGAGSGSRQAIGITTFSGMVMATLIGILFTPALYAIFQQIRETGKRILHIKPRKRKV